MPEQVTAALPKVALIYGDADAVKHLREALGGQVAIVYDAQAAAFAADQLVASGARAALVNLDSYEWLDTLTAQLGKAGVAVVFNDPETSVQLEGWEHARWLRHLVAKLRGSDDYDPPRPVAAEHAAAFVPVGESVATLVAAAPATPVPASQMSEQPLSPHEIESLTANFGGAATATPPPAAAPVAPTPRATVVDESVPVEPERLVTAPSAADDFDPALDVDTEALSAMIDARLAEPESRVQPVIADDLSMPDSKSVANAAAPVAPAVAVDPVVIPTPPPPAEDDALADLPALGDWALVDPEAPVAAAPKATRPDVSALADSFAGIELVPLDDGVPVELRTEPIEHRLYVEAKKKAEAANGKAAGANGDHA